MAKLYNDCLPCPFVDDDDDDERVVAGKRVGCGGGGRVDDATCREIIPCFIHPKIGLI